MISNKKILQCHFRAFSPSCLFRSCPADVTGELSCLSHHCTIYPVHTTVPDGPGITLSHYLFPASLPKSKCTRHYSAMSAHTALITVMIDDDLMLATRPSFFCKYVSNQCCDKQVLVLSVSHPALWGYKKTHTKTHVTFLLTADVLVICFGGFFLFFSFFFLRTLSLLF